MSTCFACYSATDLQCNYDKCLSYKQYMGASLGAAKTINTHYCK